ncbi:GNAT family N-acetyltransferase [Actinoplanes sp. NPDC023801]|uniref:GNAT family N-acetyltransferase n=1 Tax=Actinoplanes sp. NPDC023801 TaxID=3154595 RepID=UPI0034039B33
MELRSFEMRYAAVVAGWATSAHEVSLLCGREEFPFPAELLGSWPKVADDIVRYLFVDGGTPIGYGELWLDDEEDEVELARIIVAPEHRGRGHGSRLVRALLAEALKAGHANVFLRVRPGNEPAIRTYERVGFERVGAALEAEWNGPQPVAYAWYRFPIGSGSADDH